VLPALHGRPVSVAPSAVLWQRAQRRTAARADAPVTLACGPGLDHAEPEIAALRRHYPDARALTGVTATADAVCAAMDGARLVHVAAHGVFRAENPQFSSLEMADGPLTVYDLERLEHAPETLVLSSCDSGLSDVRPGDELMGLAAAVTALGTRTLVASVVPVADRRSREYMEQLHDRLIAGERPATAVAATTASTGVDGFVCLGAG
jgi:CHAT domain-containing protein